ncbi:uncharacterized protein LOC120017429 [Salvelinus namaycush]|uniref:Uncharacterized protein LOC120017429 n=1 Tax=Salvelinus namaycush TaxID=8040 RepID=A0A8U0NZY4_SALNM|nr:uncharacterized protein LOC120017429 [Salvelinus namaycush]
MQLEGNKAVRLLKLQLLNLQLSVSPLRYRQPSLVTCDGKPIAFSSQALNPTEQRYSVGKRVNGGSHSLYSSVGDDVSLPWKIQNEGNEGSERLGVGSDCSLRVRNIGADDTGVYVCRQYLTDGRAHLGEDTTVYLSVLTISMSTPETDQKHPTNVTLRCSLLTYGGPVTCDSFVRDIVSVSWVNETGGELQGDSRYQVTRVSGCDITLTVKLWRKDKNRKWWCQLTEGTRKTFVYLTSKVSGTNNINELPISRIVLCVALPLMVIVYAVYTTRRNRPLAEVSSGIEL